MFWKRLYSYLDPRTWTQQQEGNDRMRFMHRANRISILMFLVGVLVMLYRAWDR